MRAFIFLQHTIIFFKDNFWKKNKNFIKTSFHADFDKFYKLSNKKKIKSLRWV